MKKIIFLFAIAFIASFTITSAQEFVPQNQLFTIENAVTEFMPLPTQTRNEEFELKHINGDLNHIVGAATWSDWTISTCISFTAQQMEPYWGQKLIKVIVAVPPIEQFPSYQTGTAKVWLKSTTNGEVLYEQLFTPEFGTWNEVTLTTQQTIPSTGYVIGYSTTHAKLHEQSDPNPIATRPLWLSAAAQDPYKAGGAFWLCTNNPNNYKEGANFSPVDSWGNLGMIGVGMGNLVFFDNDLAGLGVSYTDPTEFKSINQPYTYSCNVYNAGSLPQNSYTVEFIDASNDVVLGTQTITEVIEPKATKAHTFDYAHDRSGTFLMKTRVTLAGDENPSNNTSDVSSVIIYDQSMKYISAQNWTNGYYPVAGELGLAVGFSDSQLVPFTGRLLSGISFGFWDASGIVGYIFPFVSLNEPNAETPLWKGMFPAPENGWSYFPIDPPILIGTEKIFFGYHVTVAGQKVVITVSQTDPPHYDSFWILEEGYGWESANDPIDPNAAMRNACIVGVTSPNLAAPTNFKVDYIDPTEECKAVLSWDFGTDDVKFRIFRNGVVIVQEHTGTTYTDTDFNPLSAHTWGVAAIHPEGLSARVEAGKPACQTGINENAKTTFFIAPNPSSDFIKITASKNINTIEIHNFLGQAVITQKNVATHETSLDISSLNNGVYFVRITTNDGTSVKKFVKQ